MHGVLVELVVVMAASVGAALLLRRLRLPPVVGFLIAGVIVGPGGLGFVSDREVIAGVAEVGVMLLLFTVGLKLRISDLWRMRNTVFGAGSIQMVVTGGLATAGIMVVGGSAVEAVTWGMVIALSSTALILWLLEGSGKTSSRHGRAMIGVLLMQDLAVVPIMLALPLLAGQSNDVAGTAWFFLRAVGVIVLTIVGARFLFPALAAKVVAAGSRELFTLTTVLVAVGTALVFDHFGLSEALGAFLAGMVVSESQYVSRMVDDVTPLRDVFNSLFFVSLGMLVKPSIWIDNPVISLGLVTLVVVGKAVLAAVAVWPVVRCRFTSLAAGLGLAQVGEFSLVIAAEAGALGLITDGGYELFLAIAVPTMIVTPGLTALAHRLADRSATVAPAIDVEDHLVIVGYGVNGRNVHQALKPLKVPHVVIDLNPHTVSELQQEGEHAVFGNAEQPSVLQAAGVERARGVIVAVPDASSTRDVVAASRRLAPKATIIARTRYVQEVEALEALGANQVIPEEFETSLELLARVLQMYGAPPSTILDRKAALRRSHYGFLRSDDGTGHAAFFDKLRSHVRLVEVEVPIDGPAAGRTLRELDLRRTAGATVLAVRRGDTIKANPSAETRVEGGDRLVIMADGECEAMVHSALRDKI
jgi:CPA2 family monovalent cation:H+ antiporter-2